MRRSAGAWPKLARDRRALGCSRDTVREVRDGMQSPDASRSSADPLWMLQLNWPAIIHDLGLGYPLKFIWQERAPQLTSYSNVWKQFYRKFPQYRQASVTAREFEPGERVEVDYAGDALEWIELTTGEIRKAFVFVAALGFSQLRLFMSDVDERSISRVPIRGARKIGGRLVCRKCTGQVRRSIGSAPFSPPFYPLRKYRRRSADVRLRVDVPAC